MDKKAIIPKCSIWCYTAIQANRDTISHTNLQIVGKIYMQSSKYNCTAVWIPLFPFSFFSETRSLYFFYLIDTSHPFAYRLYNPFAYSNSHKLYSAYKITCNNKKRKKKAYKITGNPILWYQAMFFFKKEKKNHL